MVKMEQLSGHQVRILSLIGLSITLAMGAPVAQDKDTSQINPVQEAVATVPETVPVVDAPEITQKLIAKQLLEAKGQPGEKFTKETLKEFFDDLKNYPKLVEDILAHEAFKEMLDSLSEAPDFSRDLPVDLLDENLHYLPPFIPGQNYINAELPPLKPVPNITPKEQSESQSQQSQIQLNQPIQSLPLTKPVQSQLFEQKRHDIQEPIPIQEPEPLTQPKSPPQIASKVPQQLTPQPMAKAPALTEAKVQLNSQPVQPQTEARAEARNQVQEQWTALKEEMSQTQKPTQQQQEQTSGNKPVVELNQDPANNQENIPNTIPSENKIPALSHMKAQNIGPFAEKSATELYDMEIPAYYYYFYYDDELPNGKSGVPNNAASAVQKTKEAPQATKIDPDLVKADEADLKALSVSENNNDEVSKDEEELNSLQR